MRNQDLFISIENTAAYVAEHLGEAEVLWIFSKYGAKSIEDLRSSDYEEVFGELHQREVDIELDD